VPGINFDALNDFIDNVQDVAKKAEYRALIDRSGELSVDTLDRFHNMFDVYSDYDAAAGRIDAMAAFLEPRLQSEFSFPVILVDATTCEELPRQMAQSANAYFNSKKLSLTNETPFLDVAFMLVAGHCTVHMYRFYKDESRKTDVFIFDSAGFRSYEGQCVPRFPEKAIMAGLDRPAQIFTNAVQLQYDLTSCYLFCLEFLFKYSALERHPQYLCDKEGLAGTAVAPSFFDRVSAEGVCLLPKITLTCMPAVFYKSIQSYGARCGAASVVAHPSHALSKKGTPYAGCVTKHKKSVDDVGQNKRIDHKYFTWVLKSLKAVLAKDSKTFDAPRTLDDFEVVVSFRAVITALESIAEVPEATRVKLRYLIFVLSANYKLRASEIKSLINIIAKHQEAFFNKYTMHNTRSFRRGVGYAFLSAMEASGLSTVQKASLNEAIFRVMNRDMGVTAQAIFKRLVQSKLYVHAKDALFYYKLLQLDAPSATSAHEAFGILATCTDELHEYISLAESKSMLVSLLAWCLPLNALGLQRYERSYAANKIVAFIVEMKLFSHLDVPTIIKLGDVFKLPISQFSQQTHYSFLVDSESIGPDLLEKILLLNVTFTPENVAKIIVDNPDNACLLAVCYLHAPTKVDCLGHMAPIAAALRVVNTQGHKDVTAKKKPLTLLFLQGHVIFLDAILTGNNPYKIAINDEDLVSLMQLDLDSPTLAITNKIASYIKQHVPKARCEAMYAKLSDDQKALSTMFELWGHKIGRGTVATVDDSFKRARSEGDSFGWAGPPAAAHVAPASASASAPRALSGDGQRLFGASSKRQRVKGRRRGIEADLASLAGFLKNT
jgi:hypothetical protein